jgi:hypothetical protein
LLFVTSGEGVDVVDPRSGMRVDVIKRPEGYHPTSVANSLGRLAVTWAADDKNLPGQIGVIIVAGGEKPRAARLFPAGHLPDMVAFSPDGRYLLTANEGDPRRYPGFDEPCCAGELVARGNALDQRLKARLLLADAQLGRLEVSTAMGDTDGDGDLDNLYSFGTRSFSIWRMEGHRPPKLVFDSGHDFERITAQQAPDRYNADSTSAGVPDECSPKRGPEPESVAVAKVGASVVAAIGLEKTGGAMLYDVTDPVAPVFLKYLPALDSDGVLDCAPEGVLMIAAESSPTGQTLLVLCHEASGTMTAYSLEWRP